MAQRRDATGVDVMRGLVLLRIGDGARTDQPITKRSAWFDVLAEKFDLRLDAMSADTRDLLWKNVFAAHERWVRDRRDDGAVQS